MVKTVICTIAFIALTLSASAFSEEVDLYNLQGEAVVYIDLDEDLAIYTWGGEAVSYLIRGCGSGCNYIYTWEGNHIGFFEDGVVYDLAGRIVGSVKGGLNITYYAAYAKYAQYAQYAKYARYAPYAKPAYSTTASEWSLEPFMSQDQD